MGLRVDALHRVPVRLRQTPRRLLAALRYQSDAPICVYQMGKVGSTAVHRAIAAQALPVPLYHAHMLAELDAIEASVRQNYAAPSSTLRQLAHGRELARDDPPRSDGPMERHHHCSRAGRTQCVRVLRVTPRVCPRRSHRGTSEQICTRSSLNSSATLLRSSGSSASSRRCSGSTRIPQLSVHRLVIKSSKASGRGC